jgi:hypothetical protein
VILEFRGVGEREYDAVNEKLGMQPKQDSGDFPPGMVSHAAGTTARGGLVVMEVWESQAEQATFMTERLGLALTEAGVPAPIRVTWFDVLADTRPSSTPARSDTRP